MKQEADNKGVTIPIAKARERTASATGVSERMVTKINGELKQLKSNNEDETKKFLTPKKRPGRSKTCIDDFDKCVIRRTIYNFHLQKNCLPTVNLLLQELRESIDFKGGKTTLRIVLSEMGFKWRKTKTNRKLLAEKSEIRDKRITYLRKIKRFREQNRPIIFLDETYVLSTHVKSQSWSDDSNQGVRTPVSKGNRLIVIHAGGEKGFVPNALTTWKATTHSGDYHDNVNQEMFMEWMTEKLLPNLEPNTVLVVDNAPYHNVLVDKAPTSKSKKQEMKDWLSKHNIAFSEEMFVPELYKLITQNKSKFFRYVLDETVQAQGHEILRLPPYHPDLNPIELVWADIKGYAAGKNTTFNFSDVQAITEEKIASMGPEDWFPKCQHVKKVEEEYLLKEGGIDNMLESFIISLGNDSETDSSDDESEDGMSGVEELQ
ncbi:uncharacterized protein LOC128984614 [Macrosteles quadrilineatus]|uniref:uncharacterized protein LOC128984614 n=1 Tax=Macrosteles quadrilineatus TaxID=74068 RepID=UPI0023E2A260|nr:uncharacterized protein LOC128984614 [Macrosteles quadrilineatus]